MTRFGKQWRKRKKQDIAVKCSQILKYASLISVGKLSWGMKHSAFAGAGCENQIKETLKSDSKINVFVVRWIRQTIHKEKENQIIAQILEELYDMLIQLADDIQHRFWKLTQ